jgi:hypothetical protein
MVKLPEFHNHKPVAIWIIAGFYITGAVLVSYLIARDGAPPELTPLMTAGVLILLWASVIGLIAHISRTSLHSVKMQSDRSLKIVTRFPFKKIETVVPFSSIQDAQVIAVTDIDGDPYFKGCFFLDDQRIVLVESSARAECQKAVDEFNAVRKS